MSELINQSQIIGQGMGVMIMLMICIRLAFVHREK